MARISPVITALALTSGCTPDVYNNYDIDVFVEESESDTSEDTDVDSDTDVDTDTDSDTDVEEPVNLPDILTIDFSWSYGWPFTPQLEPYETDVNFGDFQFGNTGDEPITVSEFPVLFVGDSVGDGAFWAEDWRTFFENCRLRGHEEVYAGPIDQIGARIPFTEAFTVNPGEVTVAAGVTCDLNGGPYDQPLEFAVEVPLEGEIVHDGDGVDIGNRNGFGGTGNQPGNYVILPVPEPEVCEPNATDVTMWFNGPEDGAHVLAEDDQVLVSFCVEATQNATIKELLGVVYADDNNNGDALDSRQDVAGAARNDADGLIGVDGANLSGIKLVDASGFMFMGPIDLPSNTTAGNDAYQWFAFNTDVELRANEPLCLDLSVDIAAVPVGSVFAGSIETSAMIVEDCLGHLVPSEQIWPIYIKGNDLPVLGTSDAP